MVRQIKSSNASRWSIFISPLATHLRWLAVPTSSLNTIRYVVVNAEDLALKQRPITFDAVAVMAVADVLPGAMTYHAVVECPVKVAVT